VTLPPQTERAWRDWDARSWGRALLQHYFVGDDDVPVSRLATTQEELAQAAGATADAAADARDAFLQAIRCDPATFRRRLSDASLAPAAWDRQTPPPFLAYLFFTCFAAASLDPDIAEEGVFRERLRQLLLHDEGTNYHLPDLSRLWEAFADWLTARRELGDPYRRLILPERGGMTLIGYSLRLAFPRRQDRLRLRDLLTTSDLGRAPTVPEAFQLVGRRINRFSPDFQRVFNRARTALTRSSREPLLHVIWSSILEAAALVRDVEQQHSRIEYQVLGQEDERGRLDLFVMVSGPTASLRGGAQLLPLDEAVASFDYVIAGDDGTPREISADLLAGLLQHQVPDLANSSIARAVREGLLLFSRVDSATWQLALTRPREGRLRALVRSHLSTDFQRLLPADVHSLMETRFSGWLECSEIDTTDLADPQIAPVRSLTSIRCLQRVEVGSLLHLVGGIRVDGGFLGIGGLLPKVHCADADVVTISRTPENPLGAPVLVETLTRDPEHEHRFSWPEERDLDGPHVFIARREQQNAGLRRVHFHSHGLGHHYLDPSNPSGWLVETSVSDVESAETGRDGFLEEEIRPANPIPIESARGDGLSIDADASLDARPQQSQLAEAIAALGMTRRGIAEVDLIEILRGTLREVDGFAVWAIIRGWQEAGYIDSLTKRAWRGRFYFPRRPRFVFISHDIDSSVRVALHGLSPYSLRNAVRTLFERGGAERLPSRSLSRHVPAPLWWRFESAAHAEGVVAEFGELAIKGIRGLNDIAGDFDAAVANVAPLPPGYERQRTWSFDLGGFRRFQKPSTNDDVTVEHYTRPNGPDHYVVVARGERRTTLSRSWALLFAFRQANRTAFEGLGPIGVVRLRDDGPHVPLPIARALALRSGIVGGPAEVPTVGDCYAYAVERPDQQRWLLRWLKGDKVDEAILGRFAWLMAAASSSRDEMRSLPTDLRRKLRKLDSIPAAQELADRSVPANLIVHIRRAIALTEN